MAHIEIVPGTLAQVHQIIDGLREADRIELSLMGGDPAEKIVQGWNMSNYRRIFTADGEPIVVYGVVPSLFDDGDGVPWMVATDAITKVSRKFLKASASEIERMRMGYGELRNATHKDNTVSIQWLQWLGFRIGTEPVGPGGALRMFSMPGLPGEGVSHV
jgi:hypothetical protein